MVETKSGNPGSNRIYGGLDEKKLPVFDDNTSYKGRRLNPDGYAANGNNFLFPIGGYAAIAELGDDILRI